MLVVSRRGARAFSKRVRCAHGDHRNCPNKPAQLSTSYLACPCDRGFDPKNIFFAENFSFVAPTGLRASYGALQGAVLRAGSRAKGTAASPAAA